MKLLKKEVQAELKSLKGWKLDKNVIYKNHTFKSFTDAIIFVGKVAAIAEVMDHHPDIFISYKDVEVTLTTHSSKGITMKDINFAKELEKDL